MDQISVLFSPLAGNHTLHYAAGLARILNSGLRIQGYYFVPVALGDMPLAAVPVEESRILAENQLEAAAREIRDAFPDLIVSTSLEYGDAQDAVGTDGSAGVPLMTVIPNSEQESEPMLWGVRSDELIRGLVHPVLCVVGDSSPALPRTILVAVGDSEDIPELGDPIFSRLKDHQDLRVSWFRVSVDAQQERPMEQEAIRIVYASDIESGIRAEVRSSGADWLVISPRSHNFLAELFHRNHTAHLLRDLRIPILAIR